MLAKQLKSALIATAAASAMMISGSGTALAVPFIAFNFNYSLGSVTNAGKLNFTDPSLVVQEFNAGLAAGPNGNFTDTGAFLLTTYNQVDSLALQTLFPSASLPGVGGANQLYFYYNLTGTAVTSGSSSTLTFNPGGTIGLYTETNYNPLTTTLKTGSGNIPAPDPGSTLLASFTLDSAGAKGTFLTDTLTVSSFQYNFRQSGGANNLFEDYPSGDDLFNGVVAKAFEFGSADVQSGAILFSACTGAQGSGVSGTGVNLAAAACATPSAAGQFRLGEVPEPGTLALFGFGLLGLGFAKRRRNESTAKA